MAMGPPQTLCRITVVQSTQPIIEVQIAREGGKSYGRCMLYAYPPLISPRASGRSADSMGIHGT